MRFRDRMEKVKGREKGHHREKRCCEAEAGSKLHLLYYLYIYLFYFITFFIGDFFLCHAGGASSE